MLYDASLFETLFQSGAEFDRESVIAKCVSLKRDVVQEDEFDTGSRQMLNFGHTIGHAIELSSNFQISHGQAVAAGMAIVAKAACAQGICQQHIYDRLISILQLFTLPIRTDFSANELYSFALADKKRSGDTVSLIVPKDIGNCEIMPMPVSELANFIKAGL